MEYKRYGGRVFIRLDKKWIEDLVVNLTMKMVMDDGVIDAATAMVMSM